MPIFLLFIIPFLGAILTGFIKNRWLAFLISLVPLALLGFALTSRFTLPWFPPLNIHFDLMLDNLSLIFVSLSVLIIPIAIGVADRNEYSLILALEGLLIGFFASRDLAFFTIFWEAMLIPLYFIMNLSDRPQKYEASFKFLLYMFTGSFLMIAAVLAIYLTQRTFDLEALKSIAEASPHAAWIFAAFGLAFAVKTPLFPFHAWLPDTYDQASTSGTILLSALLSKAGIYGFLRIGYELFPDSLQHFSQGLMILAIVGMIYGAMAAYRQNNFKRIFAYSSFSHVNFILAGIFAWNETAKTGAILQAFNHGIIITGLFLASGWLETRIHSTSLFTANGLARYFPRLAWLTFLFILASVALPGTNGFIGELLILYGTFLSSPIFAAFLASTVVLSLLYMLRFMQTVYFQTPTPLPSHENDIGIKQILLAIPLIALIFFIGLYPMPLLDLITKETL